jgi:hypothetical protein
LKGEGLVPVERIENKILLIRGEKVIIDSDLAELYGVETKRLNQQVRRNKDRFPRDFAFTLTRNEKAELMAKCPHLQHQRFHSGLPMAYTEHGALMAASVLRTPRAIEVSVFVVRAFVALRKLLASHANMLAKLQELEHRLEANDERVMALMQAIKSMMSERSISKIKRIGFARED